MIGLKWFKFLNHKKTPPNDSLSGVPLFPKEPYPLKLPISITKRYFTSLFCIRS
ncbi:hypothetical protein [Moraxella lacunata]|uniref:hypothetical protein n=1 Tax=Moraxella lacunata TaxID=477 RepID=UPI003EDE91A6